MLHTCPELNCSDSVEELLMKYNKCLIAARYNMELMINYVECLKEGYTNGNNN